MNLKRFIELSLMAGATFAVLFLYIVMDGLL